MLVVDDQRYFRELISGLLGELGYEVEAASSGEEALQILEQASFDIVITDLLMPGMDGCELVRRIKTLRPDQDVVVATGVVDVRSAVQAMRLGAADYLLKPFDAETLGAVLDAILQARRLRSEHTRLLEENLQYLGERSLFERAIGLFSAQEIGPICERLVEGLCLETQAQGGILWVAPERGTRGQLALACARGLVRLDAEPESLSEADLPPQCRDPALRSFTQSWGRGVAGARQALFLPLRRDRELIALVRLSDKQGGGSFDAVDQSCAEKLAHLAELAVATALRIRSLTSQLQRSPASGGATREFWDDALRHELDRSRRSGRRVSLLAWSFGPQLGTPAEAAWQLQLLEWLQGRLRTGDLVCGEEPGLALALLPETDPLGAAVLRQRIRRELLASELWQQIEPARRPELRTAGVGFPQDGQQPEELSNALASALERDRSNPARVLGLERCAFPEALSILLDEGDTERADLAPELLRFVLRELSRRPKDAGVLYVAPGTILEAALGEVLEELPEVPSETELVILGGSPRTPLESARFRRAPALPHVPQPFLLRLGEAPAYALVVGSEAERDGRRFFHTGERSIVEQLVFQLQDELARRAPEVA